jgi:hypothetical protein
MIVTVIIIGLFCLELYSGSKIISKVQLLLIDTDFIAHEFKARSYA